MGHLSYQSARPDGTLGGETARPGGLLMEISVISDSKLTAEMVAEALVTRGIAATAHVLGEGAELGDRSIVLIANGASERDISSLQRSLDGSDGATPAHVFVRQDHPRADELRVELGVPVRTMDLALDEVHQLLDDGHVPGSDPPGQPPGRPRHLDGEAGLLRELTPREREVLRELVAGGTYRDVAQRLDVSLGTVRTHSQSIRAKLDVSSSVEAVAVARRGGLRPPPGRHGALLDEATS